MSGRAAWLRKIAMPRIAVCNAAKGVGRAGSWARRYAACPLVLGHRVIVKDWVVYVCCRATASFEM